MITDLRKSQETAPQAVEHCYKVYLKPLQGMKLIIRYLHYVNQFNQQLGQYKNILKRR